MLLVYMVNSLSGVCISGEPKAKSDAISCMIRYFCIYRDSYWHHNIQHDDHKFNYQKCACVLSKKIAASLLVDVC